MAIGKGLLDRTLSEEELHGLIAASVQELAVNGKRILIIIPDGTRTMPMAQMFRLLQQEIGLRAAACDYLVALGTHPLMTDEQLTQMLGQPVENGLCDGARVFNHRWDLADTFAQVGTIPANEVAEVSGGLLSEPISIRINKLIFSYDQVLICGPVFPHEVIGFSGGNKYLFPGISGHEMIDQTHWLGALLGSYNIIGTESTPVRELVDRAAAKLKVPIACVALVAAKGGVFGLYFGSATDAWKAAAGLSARKHIEWVDRPFRRVLAIMPEMYPDLWTAAKGMYKAEPAMIDDAEVVIYAPHITEFSYTHGPHLEQIGYHCRDYFLQQWEKFSNVPRGVLAHSTHLRGEGAYDAATGFERDRVRVTLATGISRERCERMNLGYLDPANVKLEEWQARESEGIKLIPRAGETLFRIRKASVAR
jgi:nickel-dependent lactate racemase